MRWCDWEESGHRRLLTRMCRTFFRYKDDGTVEVHRWINDVQWNCFSRYSNSVQRR